MKAMLLKYATIAMIGFGALFVASQTAQTSLVSAAVAQAAEEVDPSLVQEIFMGEEDAPIEFIEYASFTCPHCANFHKTVFPQLKADYIDTGKVKFVSREVYFDRFGLWAAMVARCNAGQRYFGIVDLIYETQREWTNGQPEQIAGNLRKMGLQAGMDPETVDGCMQDAAHAQALVQVSQTQAQEDGVNATPTFVINGTRHSNMSYEDLKQVLDAEIGS